MIFNNQFISTIKIFSKKCHYPNIQIDIYSITNKNNYGRCQTKNHYRQQGAFSDRMWSAVTFNLATRFKDSTIGFESVAGKSDDQKLPPLMPT